MVIVAHAKVSRQWARLSGFGAKITALRSAHVPGFMRVVNAGRPYLEAGAPIWIIRRANPGAAVLGDSNQVTLYTPRGRVKKDLGSGQ
jgi:hypothetical protein